MRLTLTNLLVFDRTKHAGPQKILVESAIRSKLWVKRGDKITPLSSSDDAARAIRVLKVGSAIGRVMLGQSSENINRMPGCIICASQG